MAEWDNGRGSQSVEHVSNSSLLHFDRELEINVRGRCDGACPSVAEHDQLFDVTSELTFCCWVYREKCGDQRVIDCCTAGTSSPGFVVDFYRDRMRFITTPRHYHVLGTTMPLRQWVHVAVIYSVSRRLVLMFQDGEVVLSESASSALVPSSGCTPPVGFKLGSAGRGQANGGKYVGFLTNVALWHQALDERDIEELSRAPRGEVIPRGIPVPTPSVYYTLAHGGFHIGNTHVSVVNFGLLPNGEYIAGESLSALALEHNAEWQYVPTWSVILHSKLSFYIRNVIEIVLFVHGHGDSSLSVLPRELLHKIFGAIVGFYRTSCSGR